MKRQQEKLLKDTLNATGLSYSIEPGKKHFRVVLCGRQVGVYSRNNSENPYRGIENLLAGIRRAARTYGQAV